MIKYRGYNIEQANDGYAMTYRNRRTGAIIAAPARATLHEAKADVDARCRTKLGL